MFNKKAQSTLEYAVLLALIVASLLAMRVYIKRGFQGSLRSAAEQISDGNLYSPGVTNSVYVVENTIEESTVGKDDVTTSNSRLTQDINKDENVLPFASEPRRW